MVFLVCKKCRAGIRTDVATPAMREIMGWPVDGKHRPGTCDGDIEVVSDQQAGAGPGYRPENGDSN